MDINIVNPINQFESEFIYFYYFKSLKDDTFINKSLNESMEVQLEDTDLCENVMNGLNSNHYDYGRYSPHLENLSYHFHSLLKNDYESY